MIRLLIVIRILAPEIAGGIWTEARDRLADFTAWLRYQRARWVTGCGKHVATSAPRPRLIVPLAAFCDLPKAPPWPHSMPQRASGVGWGDALPTMYERYVMRGTA